ncbi:MAG: hypothetical protein AAGJ40_03585 [Planctomycetota bacterium]
MAKCDQGYLCEVCGGDVSSIVDSDLYLRYVIGQIPAEVLHTTPERHLQCNPILSQYIDDKHFDRPTVRGDFARERLDADYVQRQVTLVTRGYERLRQIQDDDDLTDVTEYPLPEYRWSPETGGQ